MLQKLKSKLLIVASLFMLLLPALVPVAASADGSTCATQGTSVQLCQSLCSGSNFDVTGNGSADQCSAQTSGSSVNNLLIKIVNIASAVVGVIAVIMIIIGGLRYITSGGDTNKVSGAKNTLLYAIIGLVIVALAQLIVHFVLGSAGTIGNG